MKRKQGRPRLNQLPKMPRDLVRFLHTKLGDLTERKYQAGMKRLREFLADAAQAARREET